MSDELIPITVWLAGRSYRIRIKPQEEEAVRKSVKLADEKITDFRAHYAGKDDQDFVAMCLLTYAADSTTEATHNPVLYDELSKMTAKIDEAIKSTD